MNRSEGLTITRIPTGIPNFDTIVGGGLPELSLTIIAGPAGAGKTTLAQQIMFHIATEERPAVYFGTLSEPTIKLLRYQQQFAFFSPAMVGRAVHFIDIGSVVAEGDLQGAADRIAEHLERLSPRLIVIDSIRAIADLGGGDIRFRTFVHNLGVMLASAGATGILIGEYSEGDVGVGSEFTVADNVVLLTQEIHADSAVRRLRVVKVRGQAPQLGRHAFRISSDGIEVFPRMVALSREPGVRADDRAGFGVKGLDEMLHGGLPRGQTCIIAGSSGTGKTLLGLHFALAGATAGEPCVMATFEESPAEHAKKMRSFGWDLGDLEKRGLLHMLYMRPVDLSIDEVIYELVRAVERMKAKRVVLNSVSGLEVALPQTERQELREGLYRMVANITSAGANLVMTNEIPEFLGDVRITSEGISFLADNIVLLRYVEIEGEIRRAITVVKMRTSAHDNVLREYRIGTTGLVVEKGFREYSGVLTGIPTPLASVEVRPYTAGLAGPERNLMTELLRLKRATAEDLARTMEAAVEETRASLERLEQGGYVIKDGRTQKPTYRVAFITPGRQASPKRKT